MVYLSSGENEISSAKHLKINGNEIGMLWKEEGFSYESDPISHLKRVKADKELFLEMASKLREYGVKDVYVLQLNKKVGKVTEGYAEIDVYVFNNIDGAEKFFNYMKNKMNGSSISGIRDEAAISSTEYSYLVRTSNAFIQVVVFDGKDVKGIIAGKIVEKAEN